jgi:hypothetical protein
MVLSDLCTLVLVNIGKIKFALLLVVEKKILPDGLMEKYP